MSVRNDLFYLENGEVSVHSEHLPFEELFLRKLVDATMVRNQLWQHERHETNDQGQAAIFVSRWDGSEVGEHKAALEKTLYAKFDVSPYYEVQWHVWQGQEFAEVRTKRTKHPLQSAVHLLDHDVSIEDTLYEVLYAVLDLDRRKVFLFLKLAEKR